jgi:hypothetical protein
MPGNYSIAGPDASAIDRDAGSIADSLADGW